MIDAMRGDEARAVIARRVESDLSSLFPGVAVAYNDDGQIEVRTTEWSGVAGLIIDRDDQMSDRDVEEATVSVVEDIADNLGPESEVPWPLCPSHHDHPLQPRLVRGRACWTCLRGDVVEIPIGQLDAL
jgi:hypothetical protein